MMKRLALKSALGATTLAFFGLAHAQSYVTLYGVVDGGLFYANKTLNTVTGQSGGATFAMNDSGLRSSLFGLKGTEDLGGGLKVNFNLESGISIANGGPADSNGNFFGRQAWVALDGKFGTFTAGLQFSPFFIALVESDPRYFTQFGSGLVNLIGNVGGTSAFTSNAISYNSPNIAGFVGKVLIAFGGAAGNFQAGRQYSASLTYQGAALMLNASIFDGNSGGTVQTPIPTTVAFEGRTLGAAYNFGLLTARASFINYKVAGQFNSDVFGVGVDSFVLPELDINGGIWVTSDRNHTANHSLMVALGTQYFLSKATSVYAQVGVVNNDGAMNTGLSVAPFSALHGVSGTTTGVGVGIEHTF
ncbi:porin [Paraburkholderia ginsengiterrae]|uniref:Porin n=1 Tax=Paraburkholderia ginsengiterrae TaxID=1462993 RepID=A0A1A9MZI3_9BURK|nr:porin [Paraburkholderia ginsengiterrae]OAJ53675.1 porin [Paraburkholderia ginsengiterrae]OAJ54336.1 porin [Paraburkholderia ginsengiterrae]